MADDNYDNPVAENDDDANGFDGYQETTVDPGIWLLLSTTIFCLCAMLVVMPLLVYRKVKQRKETEEPPVPDYVAFDATLSAETPPPPKPPEEEESSNASLSMRNIFRFDMETRKILKLAIPFTVSSLSSAIFSSLCFIFISHHVGTKDITAYAIVCILVGLTDGVLYGPISACTTLCAHAIGAGNPSLAGNYIQLAMLTYGGLNIGMYFFWSTYMYEVITFLEWGDETTAQLAQDFIRIYMWNYVLSGISDTMWQLLELADHAVEGSIISMAWGLTNAVIIGVLVTTLPEPTLQTVAWAYNFTAVLFIGIAYIEAEMGGWLIPFKEGLFYTLSLKNATAIKLMIKQAIPLSIGNFFSHAEWAVLTFFASYLGPAEVAAWAILGSIWDVFYYTTSGISDSGEIRVAHHLGKNHPKMAQLSAYKSLYISMVVAIVISIVFFALQQSIPAWFTQDETLITMLSELVPFVGVANLSMTFGMQCWSLIGAQGKYKLATWISFISSWGVCMPLAAIFVFGFFFDLQGLTAATTIGYTSTGAALSYILLASNWDKVARSIQQHNAEMAAGGDKDGTYSEEELYASLQVRSNVAKHMARRHVRLMILPPGLRSGIILGNVSSRPGTYVMAVRQWSPLYGHVQQGDALLYVNGQDVSTQNAHEIASQLKTNKQDERNLTFVVPPVRINDEDEEEDDEWVEAMAEDASSKSMSVSAAMPASSHYIL